MVQFVFSCALYSLEESRRKNFEVSFKSCCPRRDIDTPLLRHRARTVNAKMMRKRHGTLFFSSDGGAKKDRVRGGIGAIIIDREGEAGKIARINLTNYWCLDKPVSLRSWTDGEERKKRRNVVAVVISATRTSDRK